MKLREYFLCAKKTKITTFFNNSSPTHHPSTILESTPDLMESFQISVCWYTGISDNRNI